MPTASVGLASSTEQAFGVFIPKVIAVGRSESGNTAFGVFATKVIAVGKSESGNTAFGVSKKVSVTIVNDANAASSWLQVDNINDDVDADSVVASQTHAAVQTVVADVEADASVASQNQNQSDTVVTDAEADSPIVVAAFKLTSTINDDINADSVVSSVLASVADTIVDDIDAVIEVVSQLLTASDTVEDDANAKSDAEPGVFLNKATADSTIPVQRLRASAVLVNDANSGSTIVSEAVASFYEDVIVSDTNAASSIEVNTLNAYQLISDDIDAAVEIINDTAGEAWVFNTWTQAFGRYTGFDVNHVESVDGEPLFASPTGLHRFSGSSFADAKVQFGLNNFGVMQTKRLRAVYVVTKGDGIVKMATFHGMGGLLVQRNYATPSQSSDVPINRRISPARGDQGQYWGLQFEVVGGTRQEVHNIRILPLVTGRNL